MNPLLTRIEQDMDANVQHNFPNKKASYDKAVIAGEKIMFDEKTHANMELIKNPDSRKDPVTTVANGIAGLTWLMIMQTWKSWVSQHPNYTKEQKDEFFKNTYTYMIPAATVLMTKAIDFAERGLGIQFDQTMIANTTKLMGEILFKKIGVTPEMLNQVIQQGHDKMQENQQGQPPAAEQPPQQTGLLSQAVGANEL